MPARAPRGYQNLFHMQARDALWPGRTGCKAPDEGHMSIWSRRATQQPTVLAATRVGRGALGASLCREPSQYRHIASGSPPRPASHPASVAHVPIYEIGSRTYLKTIIGHSDHGKHKGLVYLSTLSSHVLIQRIKGYVSALTKHSCLSVRGTGRVAYGDNESTE